MGSWHGDGGGTASPGTKPPPFSRSLPDLPRANRRRSPLQPIAKERGSSTAPPKAARTPRQHLVPRAAPASPSPAPHPQRDPRAHLTPPPISPVPLTAPLPNPAAQPPAPATAPRLHKGSGAHLAAPSPLSRPGSAARTRHHHRPPRFLHLRSHPARGRTALSERLRTVIERAPPRRPERRRAAIECAPPRRPERPRAAIECAPPRCLERLLSAACAAGRKARGRG